MKDARLPGMSVRTKDAPKSLDSLFDASVAPRGHCRSSHAKNSIQLKYIAGAGRIDAIILPVIVRNQDRSEWIYFLAI